MEWERGEGVVNGDRWPLFLGSGGREKGMAVGVFAWW